MAERDDEIGDSSPVETELVTERGRSPLFIGVAIISALAIAGALLFGYMKLVGNNYQAQKQAEQDRAVKEQSQTSATAPRTPALAEIFEDQAMPKGSQSVIAGTVHNISGETLSDLSVEIELIRRSDGGSEMRSLAIEPKDLAPDQQGRYTLTIVSHDFKRAKLIRLKSAARPAEISFKLLPGARRPLTRPTPKTIVVERPKTSNSDFINTPDNPTSIP